MARPQDNLPPGSQQWKRSIEEDIRQLQVAQQRGDQLDGLSLSGLAQSLRKLGDQVQILTQQQAELSQQQARLTEVVDNLSAQVTRIDNLVNNQVLPGVAATVSTSAWSIDGAFATKAQTSIAVPPGYSRALVYGSGSLSMVNNDTGNTTLYGYIDINGDGGSYQTSYLNGTYRGPAIVTPIHSRSLVGLSGGSISIGILGGLGSTSGVITDLKRAQVGGFAIFLR